MQNKSSIFPENKNPPLERLSDTIKADMIQIIMATTVAATAINGNKILVDK